MTSEVIEGHIRPPSYGLISTLIILVNFCSCFIRIVVCPRQVKYDYQLGTSLGYPFITRLIKGALGKRGLDQIHQKNSCTSDIIDSTIQCLFLTTK